MRRTQHTTKIRGPVPGHNDASHKKRLGLLAVIVTVVAGLAAAGLFMVTRSDTAEAPTYVFTDVPADQPVLEPRGARGNDPFYPVEAQVLSFRNKVETQTGESMSDLDVLALDESIKTGLFGGTEENTCDPERLISFLYANPDLGEVWAGVHNIEFNEIADYVRSLEIRVLAEPTNVLNHGFDPATGGAYEIDTILDAGTAVLVDAEGIVRTRCYCGNPIKPKPAQHRPPRCIVFDTQVFTVPGGGTRVDDVPSNVVVTGQQANGALGNWIEISWGTGADQTGWTQSINLNKYHCAPPRDTGLCPGPGPVGVYAGPDTTSQVGELNGAINQVTGAVNVQGPISRVGGPDGVVVQNSFVLIRFTQPAPSIQNSGWVQVNQLNDTDCMPIAQCVNTEFATKARAGGIDIRPAGIFKVEFTGRFTTDRSATEVRFLDGGEVGWITNFYTPLPWAACEDDPAVEPVVKCVGNQRDLEYVWSTATSVDSAQRVGQVKNTPVILIGELTPTNGRVEIQMGPGGPIGWIDATKLDGNNRYCFPREVCISTGGPAWSIYKTDGVQLPGTPGGPVLIKAWTAYALDTQATTLDFHFLIQREGQTGWLNLSDLIVPADRTCGEAPVGNPSCPTSAPAISDALAEAKAGGSTGTAELEAAGVDSQELRATALRAANGACCLTKAVFDSDAANNEQAVATPVVVDLSGNTNEAGTWYEIATVYPGKWAPAVNFVDPATCTGNPTPDGCGGFVPGTTFVPQDACCIGSKVIGESGQSEGIDPPQFAEFVGTVNDHGDFIYEMRLLPEGRTVFAAPGNLAPIGLCTGNPPSGIACPVINGQDSQVGGNFAIVSRCCADLPGPGLTVVNLEGTVDTGGGDDPLNFEYLTINNGWMPGEVFVSGATCADANADISCPELSNQEPTVGPADALMCCADIGGGTFSVVTLEGTIDFQDLDPFNWEYLTVGHGWIQSEDFWDSTNCVVTQASTPSNPAEPSAPAAVTEPASPAPQVPAPVAPQDPAPSSGCSADRDGDGVCDNDDNCPRISNPDQTNSNRDLRGDACDPVEVCTQNSDGTGDRDNDGVCNQDDNCASVPNPNQENTFGGFQGDACEDPDACAGGGEDKDGDKVCDKDDNCPGTPNPDQKNGYGDARGDACEEPCPNNRVNGTECCKEGTFASKDDCFQRCPNGQDLDYERNGCETRCSNGSTVAQGQECPPECPLARQNPDTGGCCKEGTEYYHGACYVICKDGNPDLGDGCGPCRARGGDRDGDGICDRDDNCPDVRTTKQTDSDGDGIGDACDKD